MVVLNAGAKVIFAAVSEGISPSVVVGVLFHDELLEKKALFRPGVLVDVRSQWDQIVGFLIGLLRHPFDWGFDVRITFFALQVLDGYSVVDLNGVRV